MLVGVVGISGLSIAGVDAHNLMSIIGNYPVVGPVAKLAVAFPLTYHYLGGLRHFMWDFKPETLENSQVTQSSYALIAVSGAVSVGLAFVQI